MGLRIILSSMCIYGKGDIELGDCTCIGWGGDEFKAMLKFSGKNYDDWVQEVKVQEVKI